MDVDTFFDPIRQNLIDLVSRTLIDLGSARVQMTAWIRFIQALEDDAGNVIGDDRVKMPFNSGMTDVFQGSDLNEVVGRMLDHMNSKLKTQHWRIVGLGLKRFYF